MLHQENHWNCLRNKRCGTKNDDNTSHDNNIKMCVAQALNNNTKSFVGPATKSAISECNENFM